MSFFKLTVRDVPLDNQTVLVRTDYNVPLTSKGDISDDLRIQASLPTINYLLERGCRVVIISHLGRPEGHDKSLTLEPIAQHLAHLLRRDVRFVDTCVGDKVHQAVKRAPSGSVTVLENLRFYDLEEKDSHEFAEKIAKATNARYFVQDGFGVVHRSHASTHAITLLIPSVAGLLLEREYTAMTSAMDSPKRPFVAVIGGAKVKDKIPLIERFVEIADKIIVGGSLANTFLAKRGLSVGKSSVETKEFDAVDRIYSTAKKKVGHEVDKFIVLPSDLAVGSSLSAESERRVVGLEEVGDEDYVLDIGDQTIEKVVYIINGAGTVIWNGTLGYAEAPAFAHGSARLALALAEQPNTTSIIGGGDTTDFILKWDGHGGKSFTHVSTGGGASLELMAGNKLPGVESLLDARAAVGYTGNQ